MRPPAPGDAPALALLYADPALVRNSLLVPFELPGEEQLARELQSASPDRGHVFVATLGGRVCGEVRLECGRGRMAHRGTVTLLVPPDDARLAAEIPGYRASAVARALLTAVLDLADRWLLLHRLQLETYADEHWLFGVLDGCGFRPEVVRRMAALRDGVYADRLCWARLSVRVTW